MIDKLLMEIKDKLIDIRRDLHKIPEIGWKEYKTTAYIKSILEEIGLEIEEHSPTGIVGILKGAEDGKCILLRADIDALNTSENNDIPYKSCHSGFMHACGHDAHIAYTLGCAMILKKLENQIKGCVKFVFQPNEEGSCNDSGAKIMIENSILDNPKVDYALSGHIWPYIPVGEIGIVDGCAMACPSQFSIEVIGRGGHGALLYQNIDPILILNQIYMSLQGVAAQNSPQEDPIIISVGQFHAGTRDNVIPDTAMMSGTIRTLSLDTTERIKKKIESIVSSITQGHGANYNFQISSGVPTINHREVVDILLNLNKDQSYKTYSLKHGAMTGDDFGHFSKKVKSCYVYIGTRNEEKGILNPLHSTEFNIDEDSIIVATKFFSHSILNMLS
ncbi:M20 metallopeptidase family protein [Clostridium cylindrosporum]|uniref:Thermostable carboxypeptidase 1 n=1 Tax=Clostridium cylindrosporum DSM 605 TaxID=1121307 RepID=A0A0J8DAH6_CLOCY|nr:M20 family metallopeptidase [Clostridium cylindrosporum]KMT22852.1 thermostable carboxypeptidase 1 [Clostridium cylindrosporum DSM 605]